MKKFTLVTLASHSSLQILKGAKDEGFATLAISLRNNTSFYGRFPFIDNIISVSDYKEIFSLEGRLEKYNPVIIPHGSFVAYLGKSGDRKLASPYFGSKKILDVEADRHLQFAWLEDAGIKLPKIFRHVKEVDRMVIVKTHGARGGSGYFTAKNRPDLENKMKNKKIDPANVFIQEYILGVPIYLQYFYSPLRDSIELMGIDRRYESDVDGIGRLSGDMRRQFSNPTYTVIGNFPIVLRESLLPKVYDMGEKIVKASRKYAPAKGLYGPFCLETIVTPNQEFYAIEISCRIVAGTNLYIKGSSYTDLFYDFPISSGRRIAMEIKQAIKENKLDLILD